MANANNTDIFSINPDSPQEINLDELVRITLCAKSTLSLAIKESGDDDDLHNALWSVDYYLGQINQMIDHVHRDAALKVV